MNERGGINIIGNAKDEEKASIMFSCYATLLNDIGIEKCNITIMTNGHGVIYTKYGEKTIIMGNNKDGSFCESAPDWIVTEFTMLEEEVNVYTEEITKTLKDFGESAEMNETKQESDSEKLESIILSYDKEGDYGQYDSFDREPYLRYYVPIGNYKVKCKIQGGFYIESIEKHKEDGFETTDVIRQIDMSEGEEVEISIEEGQCIFLYINTEIELIKQ